MAKMAAGFAKSRRKKKVSGETSVIVIRYIVQNQCAGAHAAFLLGKRYDAVLAT